MLERLWKAKGLWLRILFCWALGSTFPFFDEENQYDLRFKLRGNQGSTKQIVLVHFDQEDWTAETGPNGNLLRSLKEFSEPTDSNYWRPDVWNKLLTKILAQNPQNVGVSFFFNDLLAKPNEEQKALRDPRVFWAGQLDTEGRPALPVTANTYGYNVALVDLREDEDHVLRRFSVPLAPVPHMALKLAESAFDSSSTQEINGFLGDTRLINYRGRRGVYPAISAISVLKGRIPPDFFRDKIVLIGSNTIPSHQFQTPFGHMNRAEVLAQVIDNVINKRWVRRLSPLTCSLYLLLILLASAAILTSYPHSVAFVFMLWLGLGTTAFSVWVFDTFCFWIPAFSPVALALLSYVIFISYQLSVKENQTWRLEQEKKILSELEQLRNNFVSLISHDLKTPIAKIQAICDRLLTTAAVDHETRDGLQALRKESVELHRYIQSILQISRLEASPVQLRKEPTDFNEVVEKAVDQVRSLARDKRQDLSVQLEPMFSIEVDGVLIQEVILNLIENAIKYTPNDGHVEIKTQEVDDKVVFEVKDDGPGIPEGDRDRLFEKFFRGQAQQTNIKGTGLGLFLVKYFIELHGGEVFLESEVGKGTRVGFTLPLQA
jgi:two-component system phosphate regulon sensor histidine kinase PhoR